MGAALTCLLLGTFYILPYYLRRKQPRNQPATIVFRMACSAVISSLSWLPLYLQLLKQVPKHAVPGLLTLFLGLRTEGLVPAILYPALLVSTLFVGVIALRACQQYEGMPARALLPDGLQACRNLLVGPLTEEFVFRSCMAPLLLIQGWQPIFVVLVAPLFFGAAHLHHLREYTVVMCIELKSAAVMVALQFAYTTVFGWIATFLLLQTGSLVAPVIAHMACNFYEFPDFNAVLQSRHKQCLVAAFLFGIAAFLSLLTPLTSPALYMNADATRQNIYVTTARKAQQAYVGFQ